MWRNVAVLDAEGRRVDGLRSRDGALRMPDHRHPVDRQGLRVIASHMFEAGARGLMTPYDEVPTDLFDVVPGKSKTGSDAVPKWELRTRSWQTMESAFLQLTPPRVVEHWVGSLDTILGTLKREQPRAKWRAACVRVAPTTQTKVVKTDRMSPSGSQDPFTLAQAYGFDQWSDAKPPPPSETAHLVREAQVVPTLRFDIVFYDSAQAPIEDPTMYHRHERNDKTTTPMEQYALTRQLNHLPESLYQERLLAKEVWDAVVNAKGDEEGLPATSLSRFTPEMVAAMLRTSTPATVGEIVGATAAEVMAYAGQAAATKPSRKPAAAPEAPAAEEPSR